MPTPVAVVETPVPSTAGERVEVVAVLRVVWWFNFVCCVVFVFSRDCFSFFVSGVLMFFGRGDAPVHPGGKILCDGGGQL